MRPRPGGDAGTAGPAEGRAARPRYPERGGRLAPCRGLKGRLPAERGDKGPGPGLGAVPGAGGAGPGTPGGSRRAGPGKGRSGAAPAAALLLSEPPLPAGCRGWFLGVAAPVVCSPQVGPGWHGGVRPGPVVPDRARARPGLALGLALCLVLLSLHSACHGNAATLPILPAQECQLSFSYLFLVFHGNLCNSNLLDFPYFLSTLPSSFSPYFCVQNYALSGTVCFTLNVQVAISLIVFVGWNRRCLQAVKLWRISQGLIPQLTFNTVLIRV